MPNWIPVQRKIKRLRWQIGDLKEQMENTKEVRIKGLLQCAIDRRKRAIKYLIENQRKNVSMHELELKFGFKYNSYYKRKI